jgi:hypothetical protein
MYEDQIQRQSNLTKERNINLFNFNKDEKMDITEEMYNEIIMYLVYNTNERLVWSSLTDAQKQLYLSYFLHIQQLFCRFCREFCYLTFSARWDLSNKSFQALIWKFYILPAVFYIYQATALNVLRNYPDK